MNLEIVYLDPHDLTPYENNTRKHTPEDIDQIKASIEADGFNDPLGMMIILLEEQSLLP